MDITGKVVLVTGASEGIGAATAQVLAARGAKVALAARSIDKLNDLSGELVDSFAVQVDMTGPESIIAMVDAVVDRFSRRGLDNARSELHLAASAFNLMKIHRAAAA